jgi:hypothetical protein
MTFCSRFGVHFSIFLGSLDLDSDCPFLSFCGGCYKHHQPTAWLVENPLVFCYGKYPSPATKMIFFFFRGLSEIDHEKVLKYD